MMASAPSPSSPRDISKLIKDRPLRGEECNLNRVECTTVPPGPEFKVDPQAVLKRPVLRKQPSVQHLKAREKMIFLGWHTPSPTDKEPESTQKVPEPQVPTPLKPSLKKQEKITKHEKATKTTSFQLIRDFNRMLFTENQAQSTTPSSKTRSYSYQALSVIDDKPLAYLTEREYYELDPESSAALTSQRLWKAFTLWHSEVYKRKRDVAKTVLHIDLFILDPNLRAALMKIRTLSCQLIETGTYHVIANQTYTLTKFYESLVQQQDEIQSSLLHFRETVKGVTVCAGRAYLLEHKTTSARSFNSDVLNAIFYRRMTCFIRHVDHLMFNTVHSMVLNAVDIILTVFQEQVGHRPCQITPPSPSDQSEAASEEESEKKVLPDFPLLTTELLLELNVLTFRPSEEDFKKAIRDLIREFKNTGMSLMPLTGDPEMVPLIEFEQEELEGGPSLNTVLEEDIHLQGIIKKIMDSLHLAFDLAHVSSRAFEHFLDFAKKNKALELVAMEQKEPDLSFFAKTLELYHGKYKEAIAIQDKMHLGLLLVDQLQLKQQLNASTLSSLEESHGMLIKLARKQVDDLLTKVGEAKTKLESYPSTTVEMAEQLIFLDEFEDGILDVQEQHDNVSKVYNLFKAYSVTVPSQDLVDFVTLQPNISLLYYLIDDAVTDRESSMDRFVSSLATDENKMQEEIRKMAQMLQNPDFLDINVNPSSLRPYFARIQTAVDRLEAQASSYNFYETRFKLEFTRFNVLEETAAKFRLILLLWNSLEEWDELHNKWQQTQLKEIDMEELNSQISKFDQYVEQLERGLPPNSSAVVLKNKVEKMKQKAPVISNLLNLRLKPGRWVSLESLVAATLDVEEVTIATLEEHDVFSYGLEILQILS
ncbi:dynein heavy chain 6, axonemal-like isoform X1 [Poecilia formosa]|uniref:dynein heavy chain 6, axonemal-like isoform X1 n=1 Tax=Poecilia formosa TaxID=48698 RepID=UPI0007B79804|nr:PREDICTED: dynein heavy chain 6, axonemal-like isoform X1 [Poecilia formosa]XP_016522319.1 PREDICTED: dynein heavy chain 6, axonemal-like isoform X1 [Poecilia formosa]